MPKTEGPINKPPSKYPVTLGSLSNLITFAITNPVNKITET